MPYMYHICQSVSMKSKAQFCTGLCKSYSTLGLTLFWGVYTSDRGDSVIKINFLPFRNMSPKRVWSLPKRRGRGGNSRKFCFPSRAKSCSFLSLSADPWTVSWPTFGRRDFRPVPVHARRSEALILFASMSMQLQGRAGSLRYHVQEHVVETSLTYFAVA